jgi:hypothetical protein
MCLRIVGLLFQWSGRKRVLGHRARPLGLSKVCFDVVRFVLACLYTSMVVAQPAPHTSQTDQNLHRQEDDIREAIFRYRIGTKQPSSSIFLSIDGKDPSDEFMVRFLDFKLHVKKASRSYFKKDPFPGFLRDRTTGKEAVKYSVGRIRWIDHESAEVQGGMYCGGLCADAGTYRVTKKHDHWTVEKYDVRMIS